MKSHLMQLYRDSDVYVRINPNTTIEPGKAVQVTPYSTTRLP
jgi:molybdopterin biosynthesis enzyme